MRKEKIPIGYVIVFTIIFLILTAISLRGIDISKFFISWPFLWPILWPILLIHILSFVFLLMIERKRKASETAAQKKLKELSEQKYRFPSMRTVKYRFLGRLAIPFLLATIFELCNIITKTHNTSPLSLFTYFLCVNLEIFISDIFHYQQLKKKQRKMLVTTFTLMIEKNMFSK